MARIYKESRYVLQLLIGKSYVAQYDDVKISFYTKNPNNQVMVDNGITIKRNIAEVKIESTLFDNLEEGLISYIVYGTKDGIPFIEERQSNYFLKTPLDFKPTTCILEDKSVTPSMGDRNVDGYIIVEEDEIYDGLSRVVIDPQTLYNEGYGQGKTDGVNEQKSKLETINITENGTYTKEDGYNHIEVNVPDLNGSYDEGYGQGKTDGVNEQKSKLEAINITENGTYTKEDGYNHIEVNVNVIPKINVKEAGIKFSDSTFTDVPEWADFYGVTDMSEMFESCNNIQTIPLIDTSNATNMYNMFYNCRNLQTIPLLNTSNVTDMYSMFQNCRNLQTIPQLNTSNVTNMSYMFQGCSNLQTIPLIDTSNVTNMSLMFGACSSLQTIPQINTSNVTNMSYMFRNCSDLQTIPQLNTSNVTNMSHMFFMEVTLNSLSSLPKLDCQKVNAMDHYFSGTRDGMSTLTDVGGWENLKCNWNDEYSLATCPNLTYQSCINILNGLYDFVGNGSTETRTLKVHQNFLDAVGEEISIGTNKGWTITV